jgi:plasmid stabilization system protein ParE
MSRRVFVLRAAQDDIAAASSWYEARRPGLGAAFLESVDGLLKRVATNAHQFPEVATGVRRGLTPRFPYSVYLTVAANRVVVLAVIHLHRHPDVWKRGM